MANTLYSTTKRITVRYWGEFISVHWYKTFFLTLKTDRRYIMSFFDKMLTCFYDGLFRKKNQYKNRVLKHNDCNMIITEIHSKAETLNFFINF